MSKSEEAIRGFYRNRIREEGKALGAPPEFPGLVHEGSSDPRRLEPRKYGNRDWRMDSVSAFGALAFAGLCLVIVPRASNRSFDRAVTVIKEIRIVKQEIFEYAQAIGLSFISR